MVAEKVFAVIAETTRRDILAALAQETKAVGQLVDELGVSQPTVSKHLRVLREAGVVTMRAQGQKRFYGINTEPLTLVATWLESLGAGTKTAPVAAPTPTEAGTVAVQQHPRNRQPAVSFPVAATETTANGTSAARPAPVPMAPAVRVPAPAAAAQALPVPAEESAPANIPTAAKSSATTETARVEGAESLAAAKSAKTATDAAPIVPATGPPTQGGALVVQSSAVQPSAVQSNELDGSMQGQISRGVGRAANKAADLLANLPAFRRRKD